MAIVNNLWLRGTRQKLAGTVLYQSMGRTLQRELAPAVSNPRTSAQMGQRVRLANVVGFYQASRAWMRGAFELKPDNQTDYNAFVSANLSTSKVSLTKAENAAGAAVVAPYRIAMGSLNPVTMTLVRGVAYETDLFCGDLGITSTTIVGEFSRFLLENNNLEEGMQLSIIKYVQQIDSSGIPFVICRPYEVILDTTSEALLSSYIPAGLVIDNGATNAAIEIDIHDFMGGVAVVLSKTTGSKIAVSTANVYLTPNNTVYAQYSTDAQQLAAVKSYGTGSEVFLSSNTANTASGVSTSPQLLSITYDGVTYGVNEPLPSQFKTGKAISFTFSAPLYATTESSMWKLTLADDALMSTNIIIPAHISGQVVSGTMEEDYDFPTGTRAAQAVLTITNDGTNTNFAVLIEPSEIE